MEFKIFGATLSLKTPSELLCAVTFTFVVGLALLSFGWLPKFNGFAYADTVKKSLDDAAKERTMIRQSIEDSQNSLELTVMRTNNDTLALIVRGNIIAMRARECEMRRAKNTAAADVLADLVSELQVEFHSYKGVDYPLRGC